MSKIGKLLYEEKTKHTMENIVLLVQIYILMSKYRFGHFLEEFDLVITIFNAWTIVGVVGVFINKLKLNLNVTKNLLRSKRNIKCRFSIFCC